MRTTSFALAALLSTSAVGQTAHDGHGAKAAGTPPQAQVAPLLAHDIEGLAGKEAALLMVTFPPGSEDPIHQHDALVYVYVLEGSIVMQVRGGPEVTLGPGGTFVEKPGDIHVVGRNASKTEAARFLAYFVKNKGVAPVLPAR